jgi:cytochrome P450
MFVKKGTDYLIFSGAGADTTSIGMRSCLYYVCSHSEAYAKVEKEVDESYRQNHLQQPISYTQTLQLPYLRAAVSKPCVCYLPLYFSSCVTLPKRELP